MARPKGTCPSCFQRVALTPRGKIWVHWEVGMNRCPGSGLDALPPEVEELITEKDTDV